MTQNIDPTSWLPQLLGPVELGDAQRSGETYLVQWDPAEKSYVAKPSSGFGSSPSGADGSQQFKSGSALVGAFNAVPLELYGAAGDGVTDDSAKMTSALAAGSVELGARTYKVSTHIVPAGGQLRGQGDKSVLSTTSNGTLLRLDLNAEDVVVRDLKLVGNATGSLQNAIECGRDGVTGTGIGRARFIGLTIENFGNYGLALSRPAQTGILFYGPQIQNCRIRFCNTGILVTQSAEYIKASNVDIRDCVVGLYIGAGNFCGVAINITACGTGVQLVPGTNDAHGQLVAFNINHNSLHYASSSYVAVDIGAITQAFTFASGNIYQGDIRANGNAGIVQFDSCQLDITNITNTNGKLRFVGCIFPMAYFVSCTESGTGWTEFVNCRANDGTVPAFIDARVNRIFSFSSDANKTLSPQDSVAENLIIAAGTITAARTITSFWAPTARRVQRVTNYTGFTVTFAWSTGTGVALATKTWALVGNDGNGNAMIIAQGTVTGTGPYVAAGAYDPSVESLTAWVRGSYSGAPWAGVASAGTSGAKSMTAPGAAPIAGTALNGFTPADFTPGSLQYLRFASNSLSDFFSAGAYTYSILFYGRSPVAAASGTGGGYADAQILGNSDTAIGLAWSSSGVSAWHYDGAVNKATPWAACSANAYHWVDVKFDGTNLMVRVDGGTWITVPTTAFSPTGSYLQLARNYGPGYADCKVEELMTSAIAVPDATLTSRRTGYCNTRYGLSL